MTPYPLLIAMMLLHEEFLCLLAVLNICTTHQAIKCFGVRVKDMPTCNSSVLHIHMFELPEI